MRASMPSTYFSNSQPSRDLPTPAVPQTATIPGRPSSTTEWKSSVTRRSSRSRPAGERRLEAVHALAATHRSDHGARREQVQRLRLALEEVLAGVVVGDRGGGQ